MTIKQIKRIATMPLNKRGDHLCIDVNENNGKLVVDLRRWYTDDDDNLMPTSKGVSIASENLPDVLKALTAASNEVGVAAKSAPAPKKAAAKPAAPAKKTTKAVRGS